jgi:replicative DNA helicase
MNESIKPPPHAVGPEKSVVSVLLRYPGMIDEVPELTPEHFYLPRTRIVFSLIQELTRKGQPIELVSFVQLLINRGQLETVGGPSEVHDLYGYEPAPNYLRHHADMLGGMLARRMTIAAGREMERVAYEAAEASEIIEVISQPISDISDTLTGNRAVVSTKAVLQDCIDHWQDLCTGAESPMGIETSLAEINAKFNGLHGQQTIVISAYPGGGKTTLAGQFAMDAATSGHNTLVCSLEMPARDLMNRMLAYVARVHGDAVTDPKKYCREVSKTSDPPKHILNAIMTAGRKIGTSPFLIEDLRGSNVHQIASCIRRAHRKNPLKLVVVDFAQRIRPIGDNSKQSREQQLSHASNYLADLAKELGFCHILASQLNKDGAAKHAESINEDADLHLRIVQNGDKASSDYKAHIGIAVDKDRHHGQDGVLLPITLDGPMLRFIPKPFEKK